MATLGELAKLVGGELRGDPNIAIEALMPLEYAGAGHVSFFANPKYEAAAKATQASALIAKAPLEGGPQQLIVHPDPYLAAAKVARFFHPPDLRPPGRHPSAVVDAGATVSQKAYIGPLAVVEAGATIEDGAQLHAQCYVGEGASVGAATILYAGVKLMKGTQVGARCILNAGVVIGSEGFGFAEDKAAEPGKVRVKVPQLGIVVIGDDVEIGANSTIDRATFGVTHIGNGTKIDNLVQIGHNVRTGEDCVLVGQVGVAGSAKLGRRVILGGQCGIGGHITIGDDVMVQAQSGVNKSVPAGKQIGGTPALDHREYIRQQMALRSLDEIRKKVYGIRPAGSRDSEK
ncbi:MAG: UDP-3-O-(3-hydroxymyristoyl)glucosamine N-acyltransferase [Deltaproteobacteria bacterium]|nr:UDP-3-O-(3-hydroxymyristoyl)glucosamine N-acyltransferase [Deltaproteobacteria bacterium]